MKNYRFLSVAVEDRTIAIRWYLEHGGPEVAAAFLDATIACARQLSSAHAVVDELEIRDMVVRRARIRGFKYHSLLFAEGEAENVIVALEHSSQRPLSWLERLV